MNNSWRSQYLRYKTYFLNVYLQYQGRADMKAYTEIFLSLITISIFSLFALKPTLATIADLIRQIEWKKTAITSLDNKIDQISRSQLLYDQQRRNIALLKIAVPEYGKPDVVLRQIENLASKHRVEVDMIKAGDIPLAGKITDTKTEAIAFKNDSYSFSFSINSPIDQYDSLINFLSDLEKLRTLLKIDSVSFSQNSKKEDTNQQIRVTVDSRIPFFNSQITKK